MMTPDGEARCGGESCRGVMSRPDFPAHPEIELRVLLLEAGPLVAPLSEDGKLRLPRERRTALQKYLLIILGGGLGSAARYWVGSTVGGRMGLRFPYGTLVVNITACLVIGFALTWLGDRAENSPAWRYLVAVGFIGAYSTFSTFEWETLSTLRSGAF